MNEYKNPVQVVQSLDWMETCKQYQQQLVINNPLVITSKGNLERCRLAKRYNPASIFSEVLPNPTLESCQKAINFSFRIPHDGLIAIGGGSVLDTGKAILAGLGMDVENIVELLAVDKPFRTNTPSIFIPTTHGSGSEVTQWGTIWDMNERKKYSLSNPDLYPTIAVLDGSLTLSLPLDISLITALDALSHSFEAIWNKNANSTSTDFAILAISIILQNIESLKHDIQNLEIRTKLLKASNMAGLAFSNTKTAAAHSISYPLTAYFNIPHGIAASMALIPLIEINGSMIQTELAQLMDKLNLNKISELIDRIKRIPHRVLKYTLKDWGVKKAQIDGLVEQSFAKGRMDNNIIDLTEDQVHWILHEIF